MLNGMLDILKAYWSFFAAAFGLASAFIVYRANAEEISYWLMNWWYALPFVGRLARLSGDLTRSNRPGWLKAEQTLCADYRKHVMPLSCASFANYHAFLKKAHDHGRRPLPMWMWLFLGVLIVAEGLGFSYLLGAQMALEGSENVRTTLMMAIVLVISGILLWVTHAAGHQLYRTGLLRTCFKQWKASGSEKPLSVYPISLSEDQDIDNGDPEYSQCVSRVKARPVDRGNYVWVYIAVILIGSIAVGSTWLRFSHFAATRVASTVNATADPFAEQNDSLPGVVSAPQEAADAKAERDAASASKSEATAAFVTLGFIFAITQIVGIGAGYGYGFGAKESYKAWRQTRGHSDYNDYALPFEHRVQTAEARLQQLQQRLGENEGIIVPVGKTFKDYVTETTRSGADIFAVDTILRTDAGRAQAKAATTEAIAGGSGSGATLTDGNDGEDPVGLALARVDAATTRDQKLAILADIPEEHDDAVHEKLRARRAARNGAVEKKFGDLL
jgi:hypothetical protein